MYLGYRNKRINVISNDKFSSDSLDIIELDNQFKDIPNDILIADYEVRRGVVMRKDTPTPLNEIKLALVGVYNIKCGISTYAEALFPSLGARVKDFKIFAENSNTPSDDRVIRCWERGKPLTTLVQEINSYDPDYLIIQHEYGIFPVARHWLSFIAQMQKYKTFVTLHSVYKHRDKTICEAAIPNIIVHTEIAKNILKVEKKVPGKVTVIPHFCIPCNSYDKYWNLYHSNHTLVQFGFGFRYKGWEASIEVVDQLRNDYPDIFFTGLFSESDFSKHQHDQYFDELYDLIRRKNLTEHVAIIRGYQSDETLDSYLRTNQISIFPYIENGEHTVYGCSGAARLAMRAGIPVIASSAPLFDDLTGVCPRPSNISELCIEVRRLFDNLENVYAQQERQKLFLESNSLQNITNAYVNLLS